MKKYIATLGTLSAIAIPVAALISCGDAWEDINPSDVAIKINNNDITINDLIANTKTKEKASSSLLSRAVYQTAFYLYEQEQKGSLKLQKMYFEWEKSEKEEELNGNGKTQSSDAIKGKQTELSEAKAWITNNPNAVEDEINKKKEYIKTLEKDIQDLNKDINQIIDKVSKIDTMIDDNTTNDDLNYDDYEFTTKYPKVLKPISKIRETKSKQYHDEKNNFISQPQDKKDGIKSWIDEMAKKYNNAKSDDEAIEYLVHQEIKDQALAQFKFKINSQFTKKQKTSQKFSFLSNVDDSGLEKDGITQKVLKDSDKLYFLGTDSKIPEKMVVDNGQRDGILTELSKLNLVSTRHALVDVKQDTKGDSLPWTVTKDMVKKLLEVITIDGNKYKGIELFKNMFAGSNKNDDIFLKFISSNKGTKLFHGDLGVDSFTHLVAQTEPMYGMGLLESSLDTSKPADGVEWEGIERLNKIQNKLEEAVSGRQNINQYIDSIPEADFKETFGKIFRDVFDQHDENVIEDGFGIDKLYYKMGVNRALIISSSGLHIVGYEQIISSTKISDTLEKQLKKANAAQDEKELTTKYGDLFTTYFSNERIIKYLSNFDSSSKTTQQSEYIKYLKDHITNEKDENGNDLSATQVFTWIKNKVASILKNNKTKRVNDALSNKLPTLLEKYDKGLYDSAGNVTPQDLYNDLFQKGGSN